MRLSHWLNSRELARMQHKTEDPRLSHALGQV